MASNQFGQVFRITTWGESHGPSIGVVIDGCPALLPLCEEDIQSELALRRPGLGPFTSPRKEEDRAQILSGVFEGKTTGAPIAIIIPNQDADSSVYEKIKNLYRPGHANFTYEAKYGHFDYRGGGRASARETACRVAAASVAKKLLALKGIQIASYIIQIGPVCASRIDQMQIDAVIEQTIQSPLFCPDKKSEMAMIKALEQVQKEGDSLGGIIQVRAEGMMPGLGDPVYEKLDANLGKALLSIPACKGVEIGSGFAAAGKKGSENNDPFDCTPNGDLITTSNHAGGILGGISSGMPLLVQAAFKPTSSIKKEQKTRTKDKQQTTFAIPPNGKHDLCVAIRAVPVCGAMVALVLIDALLMNQNARINLSILKEGGADPSFAPSLDEQTLDKPLQDKEALLN